ncbi:hypothetical protein FD723_13450 [Nostoc sp. C052]|uniref:hypothetical protein n=1 Tax=Nostoc sp. C052 TaxID=2576902 RepID=UPI0015C3BFDD|nr:hypothetical protein [Nostoc sp. C052]QLE41345.1 hypothetical protein FD723_13450 [Nostoc sp. C052]
MYKHSENTSTFSVRLTKNLELLFYSFKKSVQLENPDFRKHPKCASYIKLRLQIVIAIAT